MKYRKLQTVHENTKFFIFKPLGILFNKKTQFWFFLLYQYLFNHNIFLNRTYPNTCVYIRDRYWYQFYMVFISMYIDKGITKVPISTETRVHVQESTSKTWNSPVVFGQLCRKVRAEISKMRYINNTDVSWIFLAVGAVLVQVLQFYILNIVCCRYSIVPTIPTQRIYDDILYAVCHKK